jgi:hypothetical protein
MRLLTLKTLFTSFLLWGSLSLHAQRWLGTEEAIPSNQIESRAAGCSPATSITTLELNNVRAIIHTGGNLWQNPGVNASTYEIPKGSGIHALFTGGLWLGGEDVNGQLKLAAVRYRQGNDYWTGPLTTAGDAEITASTCEAWDRHFIITRQEVETFNAWYEAGLFDQNNPGSTTQADDFPGYEIPSSIVDWPAHGDQALDQDFYIAPFFDRDEDGIYDISKGDYPWYDLDKEVDCQTDRTVTLFGDYTIWWVFNDKGNIHTETGSDPIGMEIRAQSFAFATNDEVNNMTFLNFELINRSTQTLTNTYFGQFIDVALGGPFDDYVGCDVGRGLGYTYNGNAVDNNDGGWLGYGANPPAIGVDFFEGPYQDNDGIDNAVGIGPNEAVEGNGLGYGDQVIDNERFGMRRFVYYNNTGSGPASQTDPLVGIDYYNYLRGFWKDNTRFVYGGNAHISDPSADPSVPCDFMFPGDSDPLGWGTGGVPQPYWTEQTAGNLPYDRRFMQSAGPFILEPGAVNNITVGIVYARATSGDPFQSVEALRIADDKAQALFENCFRVLDGPDAPDITIQEMDKELILYLSNPPASNNPTEEYAESDFSIVTPDSLVQQGIIYDSEYKFQGYQVFQLESETVSPTELIDIDKARLVAQCDMQDGIGRVINFEFNEDLGTSIPVEKVNGADEGIVHSFQLTDDQFAQGDRRFINHIKYHYMAIAYAYNNYKSYSPDDASLLDGQKLPYLASRKGATGSIKVFTGIPHIVSPEASGTVAHSEYGDGPEITRIEGMGNGNLGLDFTSATEANIVANSRMDHPTYEGGRGPINVKVIDPLNVPKGTFRLRMIPHPTEDLDSASWVMYNTAGTEINGLDSIWSQKTIAVGTEQLIPEWGISVSAQQHNYVLRGSNFFTDLIESSYNYADSSQQWLTGVADQEGFVAQNWIRCGTSEEENPPNDIYNDYLGVDDEEVYEGVLGGTWAPYSVVSSSQAHSPISNIFSGTRTMLDISDLQSIDIVFTSDQSKWTKCPVLEMQDESTLAADNIAKQYQRIAASVDKNGNVDSSGYTGTGMGWFPGYVIDLESGERLNMAFGEDTWLAGENGRDMQFNPTDRTYTSLGTELFGGKHYVYIFKNQDRDFPGAGRMPIYDEGHYIDSMLNGNTGTRIKVWRSCIWVGIPMVEQGETFLSNDAKIKIRVSKSYEQYATGGWYLADSVAANAINEWNPLYEFSLDDLATETTSSVALDTALNLINVVPNPYYAYSLYEENKLENTIKFTNLPEQCTITIYNVGGTIIRQLTKDSPITSLNWDLKNHARIPIASGVYIIHIEVPGVGERILKWFGVMRQIDLESY